MPAPAFAVLFSTFSRIIAQRAAGAAASAAATGDRGAAAGKGMQFAELLAQRTSPIQHIMEKKRQQQERREAVMGDVGEVAGKTIAGASKVIALGGVFGALTATGAKLAEAQMNSQRSLAKFNGTIAVAYAKLQRSDVIRAIQCRGDCQVNVYLDRRRRPNA